MGEIHQIKRFPAELSQLPVMIESVVEPITKASLDKKAIYSINLALEEVLVNIISYAYPDTTGELTIEFTVKDGYTEIKVIDSGIPFNPLEKSDPDLDMPVEDRQIGGLGIFMVREMMDEVDYSRGNKQNILTMIKRG
jgi:anti-sigma regulatory factor (Ser/Thr protein kinase)